MTTIRHDAPKIRRNERCPCGSTKKFKHCCLPAYSGLNKKPKPAVHYIDSGEEAVRWVICDDTGRKFFSDKDGRILVFTARELATAIALLEDFSDQAPGEINVAGVGPTKWELLKEKLPYVEVESVEAAVALVRERMLVQRANLEEEQAAATRQVVTETPLATEGPTE